MTRRSDKIEALIEIDDWKGARKAIVSRLRKEPQSHWLLSRLALTYYEEFEYEKALEIETQALKLAPKCPLVLWGYAGALDMLGRERKALRVYQRLVRRGVESIAYGECGEGLALARGMVADSFYRMADCYEALGQNKKALDALEKHLDLRGPGCYSIYPLHELHKELNQMRKRRLHPERAIYQALAADAPVRYFLGWLSWRRS